MNSDYLNLTQAATAIGVSRMTIHRWIKQGKLTPIKIGDYPLLTPAQLYPYIAGKHCTNCGYEKHENGTTVCACREISDMEDGCKDWVWKWN